MKVFSLYDKDKTFLGAFPSRDMCVTYAKVLHPDANGWDYDVIEEYLSKTPPLYTPPYYTSRHSIPCKTILDTGITQTFDKPVEYNKGVQAGIDKPIPGGWI